MNLVFCSYELVEIKKECATPYNLTMEFFKTKGVIIDLYHTQNASNQNCKIFIKPTPEHGLVIQQQYLTQKEILTETINRKGGDFFTDEVIFVRKAVGETAAIHLILPVARNRVRFHARNEIRKHRLIVNLYQLKSNGETDANVTKTIQGQSDVKLNSRGIEQSLKLRDYFKANGTKFDLIYSSDLSRALKTCELIVGDNTRIVTDKRLRERSFGVLQGKPSQVFAEEARSAGVEEYEYTPIGGENVQDVSERAIDFLNTQLLPNAKVNSTVLIVSHGGLIIQLMRYFKQSLHCQFPEPLRITPNTAINTFVVHFTTKKFSRVVSVRTHCIDHLSENSDSSSDTVKNGFVSETKAF
ncbi:phosphoglycerate mutase-like protein [Dinothrombium tinctorium]|uniref:Phosphoglycerate mutase-like protein n=1 Tax=Dinothrombium tinctorium TaxID=1965070 RepID=A0A443RIC9_9ACAR|nr:phosphoglycerate mutase-like protein [Dinothrombium tinctorium]